MFLKKQTNSKQLFVVKHKMFRKWKVVYIRCCGQTPFFCARTGSCEFG